MLIGLVVAMKEEAEPIIREYGLEMKSEGVYEGRAGENNVILALSGIGKVNAQNTAWQLISLGVDSVVNVGTCGDLGNHGVGTCVMPNIFFDGDFDLSMMDTTSKDPANVNRRYMMTADSKMPAVKEVCYTYSTFVTDKRAEGAIVDMEAYSIASACVTVQVPFVAVKCISDGADEEAVDTFDKNVSVVVLKNIDIIKNVLENFESVYSLVYKLED